MVRENLTNTTTINFPCGGGRSLLNFTTLKLLQRESMGKEEAREFVASERK